MLVQPSEKITQDLATKISEARDETKSSCLDQPKLAAEHLVSKEELNMFYGESHEAEWPIAILTAAKVVVVGGALVTAALAVNGPSTYLSGELDNLAQAEVDDLSVDDLIKVRRNGVA